MLKPGAPLIFIERREWLSFDSSGMWLYPSMGERGAAVSVSQFNLDEKYELSYLSSTNMGHLICSGFNLALPVLDPFAEHPATNTRTPID